MDFNCITGCFTKFHNINKDFFRAINYGQYDQVVYFLKNNLVDPATENNTAIFYAAKKGYIGLIKLLLEYPTVDPSIALTIKGLPNEIKELLEQGIYRNDSSKYNDLYKCKMINNKIKYCTLENYDPDNSLNNPRLIN